MEKTVSSPKKCFVITPIGEEASVTRSNTDTLIADVIRPILEPEFEVIVAHEIAKAGSINRQIIEEIITSDLVIANLSGTNPNVMYELALRHCTNKPVIQIAEKGTLVPFDIHSLRTIFYENTYRGFLKLNSELQKYADAFSIMDTSDNPIIETVKLRKITNAFCKTNESFSFENYALPKECTDTLLDEYKKYACASVYLKSDSKSEHFKIDDEKFTYIKSVSRKLVFANPKHVHFSYSFSVNYAGKKNYENDDAFLHAKIADISLTLDGKSLEEYYDKYLLEYPEDLQKFPAKYIASRNIFDLFTVTTDYNSPTSNNRSTNIKAMLPVFAQKDQFTVEYKYISSGDLGNGNLSFTFRIKYATNSFRHIFSVEPSDKYIVQLTPIMQYYLYDQSIENRSKDNPVIRNTDNRSSESMIMNGWIMPGNGYKRIVKLKNEYLPEYNRRRYFPNIDAGTQINGLTETGINEDTGKFRE
jgi:hypothetical protein